MIIDTFPLEYEREILLIRLRELRNVVDKHVIVEAPMTFSGNPRELFWPTIADLPEFREFAGKVEYRVTSFEVKEPWLREQEMRDVTLRCARALCSHGRDLILLGDVDEIPHPLALRRARLSLSQRAGLSLSGLKWTMDDASVKPLPVKLVTRYHQLRLNLRAAASPTHLWEFRQPILTTYAYAMTRTGTALRAESGRFGEVGIEGAGRYGWHLTCQGSAEQVRAKLRAGAHTEWSWLTEKHIAARIAAREELCRRDVLMPVPDVEMPPSVLEDRDYFQHLMLAEANA